MNKRFGLIGRSLKHSQSPNLFNKYIHNKDFTYELCEIEPNELNKDLLLSFDGLNVTIPYKKEVIPLLDELDEHAKEMQSVNCIENKNGHLIGHNTDYVGICNTLDLYIANNKLLKNDLKALVLGNGGVSSTIQYYLKNNNIKYTIAGRSGKYDININKIGDLNEYQFIINTTPVGMYPNITDKLDLPYHTIGPTTVIFDLIYNPNPTEFLKECKKYTAVTLGGSTMLESQAVASYIFWKIL